MGKTIVEKIFSSSCGYDAKAGDIVICNIDRAMIHDVNGPLTIDFFRQLGVDKVKDSSKGVFFLDHFAPCNTVSAANSHLKIREFARQQGIALFQPGEGICHQLMIEQGLVAPGMLVVGTDSHTSSYGAVNAVGTSIGATEMAVALAGGTCWFKVPETIKIELTGELREYVTAKDIALEYIRQLKESGAMYQALEFSGEGLSKLSVESRTVLCNMAVETGAKTALMPGDEMLAKWLAERGLPAGELYTADEDAVYAGKIIINLSTLQAKIAVPSQIDKVADVKEVAGQHVDQVILGSCTNGRLEDFRIAAQIMQDRPLHTGTKLILIPASRRIYLELMTEGILEKFVKAGAIVNVPGCGPCAGLHSGLVGDGEVVLSTTNRNTQGRMGSSKAQVFIGSPVIAILAALTGEICDPETVLRGMDL